jgi:hypothetical protein
MTVRDDLGRYAHDDSWAGWMKYMFQRCVGNSDGTVTIPADLVRRWTRQMNTIYDELPEQEKKSDLEEADKILAIVKQHTPTFWTPFPGKWEVIDTPYDWDYDGDTYEVVYQIEYDTIMFIFARPRTHNGIAVEERALIQVRWKDDQIAKGYLLDRGELLHWYLGIQHLCAVLLTEDAWAVSTLSTKESTTVPE